LFKSGEPGYVAGQQHGLIAAAATIALVLYGSSLPISRLLSQPLALQRQLWVQAWLTVMPLFLKMERVLPMPLVCAGHILVVAILIGISLLKMN